MNKRVEILSDKLKNIKLSLMGIFMVILSIFVLFIGFSSGNILSIIFNGGIGIFGLLFFGAATVVYFRNIFVTKPVLILEKDGFYDNSSIVSMKNALIGWDSVASIKYMPIMNQGMVAIFLKDQNEYLDNLPLVKRWLTKMNIALGYGEITINMNQIQDIDGAELANTMNKYLKNHHN